MILKSLPFLLQLGSLLFLPLHTPIVTGTVSLSTMVPSSSVPLSSTSSSSAAIVTPSSSSYLPLHVLKPLDASEPKHIGEFSDTSSLTVFYPPGRNASLRHSNALFGIPTYGGSITARIYYPSAPANGSGCTDLSVDPNIPTTEPIIMLLDRGGCSFSQKIMNAQRVNAVGAIVADTNGLCNVSPECGNFQCSQCPLGTTTPLCSCFLPYMAGGPGANDIVIPSFMIGRDDATVIRPYAGPGPVGQLYASMAWDIPNRNGNVEYQLWLDANDALSYQFRIGFQPFIPYLASNAIFTPRFYIWDGRAAGCGVVFDCATQCINNGYYCNIDPDGDLFKGISGADVVMEHLREICIWQEVNKTYSQDYGLRWWNYAQYFSERCSDPITWNRDCSELCMIDADINVLNVRQCVQQSNSSVRPNQNDYTNILLQEALNLRNEMAIIVLPSAVVNDAILRGGTSPLNLLTAICGGFGNSKLLPPVCNCLSVPINEIPNCIANSNNNNNNDNSSGLPGWGKGLIAVVVLGLIGSIIGGLYVRNRTKQEVQEMLDDYVALVGDENEANNNDVTGNNGSNPVNRQWNRAGSKKTTDKNTAVNQLISKLSSLLTPPPSGSQFVQIQQQQQQNVNNRATVPPVPAPATVIIGSTQFSLSTASSSSINQ